MGETLTDYHNNMTSSQLPMSNETQQEALTLPIYDRLSYEPSQDDSPLDSSWLHPSVHENELPFPEVKVYKPAKSLYDNLAFMRLIERYGEERVLKAIQVEYAGYNDEDQTDEYLAYGLLHDPEVWENTDNDEQMALVQGFYSLRYSDPDILNAFEA